VTSLLELTASVPSGLWHFGIRYIVLEVRRAAHWRASVHFYSEMSRLRLARGRGMGIARTSVRSD